MSPSALTMAIPALWRSNNTALPFTVDPEEGVRIDSVGAKGAGVVAEDGIAVIGLLVSV